MIDEMKEAVEMSNLGGYQWLTATAKKVGGPKNLVFVIAGAGAVIYKSGEIAVKQTAKAIKRIKSKKQLPETANTKIYTVTADGISNEGLELRIGDQFRVLESDKDAVLIEKIGDDNNPYFVSAELLRNISNYN